jgi:hypothetical protein
MMVGRRQAKGTPVMSAAAHVRASLEGGIMVWKVKGRPEESGRPFAFDSVYVLVLSAEGPD